MSYGKDLAAVLKGVQLVGRAVVREQIRQCERQWETGSLKPCSDAATKKVTEISRQATDLQALQKFAVDAALRGQVFMEGIVKGLPVAIFRQTSTPDETNFNDISGPDVVFDENSSKQFSSEAISLDADAIYPNLNDKSVPISPDLVEAKIKLGTFEKTEQEENAEKSKISTFDSSQTSTGFENTGQNEVADKLKILPAIDLSQKNDETFKNVPLTIESQNLTNTSQNEFKAQPIEFPQQTKETPKVEPLTIEKQKLNETSKERKVPSSRISRLASYGNLAVGLSFGAISEVTKRSLGFGNQSTDTQSSGVLDQNPFLTEENAERIVNTLCRVRGAALKLGQMLSIQDNSLINPQLQKIFERVRYGADFMPAKQLEKTIRSELGDDWRKLFTSFDEIPLAAASIGQVHSAVLQDGREVALKVQYPGVAQGIESDIKNLVGIMTFGNILPKGLYLTSLIKVARQELIMECDYLNEAQSSKRFKALVADDPAYYVPYVVDELTTKQILTTELIYGLPLDKCVGLDQATRNWLGEKILHLCLRELFEFRFMQTDPNWSNFFYDARLKRIILLDFGASREFSPKFTDQYMKIIKAAADRDRKAVLDYSRKIGFLTGYESKIMEEAHCDAVMILGEAFVSDDPLDFGTQDTTRRITELVPVMVKHRLTPPPEEIYSLHRKLSGAFLLCAKLKSNISCKPLFDKIYKEYKFETELP